MKTFFLYSTFGVVYLQGTQSFTCVLPVITVMVCLAVTSVEGQDPGRVLCTLIELPWEHAARVTACSALLVHSVTAQVRCYIQYYTQNTYSNFKSVILI